jgi:hypothetical protein
VVDVGCAFQPCFVTREVKAGTRLSGGDNGIHSAQLMLQQGIILHMVGGSLAEPV